MRPVEITIGRKTYRVNTLDVGKGPEPLVFVLVPIPNGVICSHRWREVSRNGPTWNRVISQVELLIAQPQE